MEVSFGCINTQLTGPVTDGTCVRQVFFASADILESVSVFFSTYGKTLLEGVVVVEIIDFVTEKKIATVQINASELKDNDWHAFPLNAPLSMRQKYEMRLWTINCRSGQAFTLHQGSRKNWGYLFMGARMVRLAELKCRFVYAGETK